MIGGARNPTPWRLGFQSAPTPALLCLRRLPSPQAAGGRGAPARPSVHAHREALEAAPSGIVSGLDLGRLNSSHAGGSLRKVDAEAAAAGARVFADLYTRGSASLPYPLDEEDRAKCLHFIVLAGDEFRARGRTMELSCFRAGSRRTPRSRSSGRGRSRSWSPSS